MKCFSVLKFLITPDFVNVAMLRPQPGNSPLNRIFAWASSGGFCNAGSRLSFSSLPMAIEAPSSFSAMSLRH
jgi:hypothetical protein